MRRAGIVRQIDPEAKSAAFEAMTIDADPSTRFILEEGSPYLRNMAMLWENDPELAGRIDALDEEGYAVEPSRSGEPTVAVACEDGRRIYLHSRFKPVEEAQRLAKSVKVEGRVAFYAQGFGLGYHIEALLDRISSESLVCVFEPDLRLLKTALWARDLSALLSGKRVQFFVNPDKSEIFSRLQPHMVMLSMGFEAMTHAPSLSAAPAFHQQVQVWLGEYAAYCRTSLQTLVSNGRRTAQNIARNLGWYIAAPPIARLKDKYKGRPAVVVSAGPSLRKNKHLLKGLEDRAVLVSVQTTLRPLLEMGIEPHFVTSLDYHDICTRFFEKLPPDLKTELVAEPKATSRIFRMNPGPLTLLGNDFAEKLLREMKLDKGQLPAGATVAHLAYYLAEHLGCDPIIFVGQDLGFSDGLCYAPGTSYEDVWRPELSRFCTMEMKQWEHIVRDRRILRRIPDVEGRPMYTEERLYTYLQQFERDFLKSGRTIIDATEGGALKRGSRPMPLAEAIEQYCGQPLSPVPADHPGLGWQRVREGMDCLKRRRDEAGEIERISRQTLPLLEEIRDHLDDQSRVNRAIARIDALRARMNQLGPCYDLILQLTQSSELDRFQRDRRISAETTKGLERQRRQVQRDVENVKSVTAAAEAFIQLMDETLSHLAALTTEMEAA
jgi:hypothetical protein